jgi:4-cresol dehydrogenase (hydroxylating) flavoprotein subunit
MGEGKMSMSTEKALQAMEAAVGSEYVDTTSNTLNQLAVNMIAVDSVLPAGIVRPKTVEEIQALLKIANEYKTPLWAFSTGQNLGYGQACATKPGSVMVDLSRMNKIIEVNEDLAYALVEPGVTFMQMYQYLQDNDIPLWMDVSSGSPGGSYLGNITERGAGYTPLGEKFLFSCGMEVVLANGKVLRTGTGTLPNSQTWQIFKWGYGPYLDGLFTSSNFGIVTKIGFWLMPKPPVYEPLAVVMDGPDSVYKAIEILRPLKLNMVIPNGACVTHVRKSLGLTACWGESSNILPKVGRRFDYSSDVLDELKETYRLGDWNFAGALYGLPETVEMYKKIVQDAFAAAVPGHRFLDADEQQSSPYWKARRKAMRGAPIDTFDMSDWIGKSGALWISPVAPVRHDHVRQQITIAEDTYRKYGFHYSAELILGTGRDLHHIIWLMFDKTSQEERHRAHQCVKEMYDRYCDVGYMPYRTDISMGDHLMRKLGLFRDICHDLKRVFDPNNILSPGKSGIDLS